MAENRDVQILRDLVQEYLELAHQPVQDERRDLWRAHHDLQPTRPLVLARFGSWNAWCGEVFSDQNMQCEDAFFRAHERTLRMEIAHATTGDDYIIEPWLTQGAAYKTGGGIHGSLWGFPEEFRHTGQRGGAWKKRAQIQEWSDVAKLVPPRHEIDEAATQAAVGKLHEAVGDLITIDVPRGPVLMDFAGDISTTISSLRGLDRLMLDMYEYPEELKSLLATMRDAVLANQQAAEDAGDISRSCGSNQQLPYGGGLEDPRPNSGPCKRKDIWGFFAAQEYALISPKFHDEFLYQYQLPIMAHFGRTHYGCCEDLTHKIDMLRQAPNLRSIAVTPRADLAESAEQIGADYVISWRPNPADMVCTAWDEDRIRRIIGEGLRAAKGTRIHIHLKDIETVQGDPSRLGRWVDIVRDVIDEVW